MILNKIKSKKVILISAIILLISISFIIAIYCYINLYFKIQKGDSTIGYVKNMDEYYSAVNSIKSESADNVDIDSQLDNVSVEKVVSHSLNASSADDIQQAILDVTPEIISAYGIYVDNNFICAVEDQDLTDEILKDFAKSYISVKSDIELISGYYNSSDVVTDDVYKVVYNKIALAVNTEEVYIETVTKTTIYNTKYIQNSNLPQGTSKISKEGSNGITVTKTKYTKQNGQVVSSELISSETIQELSDCIIETGVGRSNSIYIVPVTGRLSSPFGIRSDPITDAISFHNGVDIAAATGTPIYAAASGTVIKASDSGNGFGNCVIIKHRDGSETLYGHCSALLVSVGDHVSQGRKIALVGSTGRSTGPHLHFSIIINGEYVNPQLYIKVKK